MMTMSKLILILLKILILLLIQILCSIREQEAPLSLYWFIDEDENNKSPSAIQASNQDKIQSMEIKLQTMEENIKKLLTLLQNQQE